MSLPTHHISSIVCKAFCFAAMLVVCAGCHKDENGELPEQSQQEMRFAANVTPTRADVSPLQETYTSFLVYTYKKMSDNSVQTVMHSYLVKYDADNEYYDSHWYYEGVNGQYLKYWDPSATQYTFMAIAPGEVEETSGTQLASEKVNIEVNEAGNMTLRNLSANISTGDNDNSSNSIDWVVANTIRTMGTTKDEDELDDTHIFPTPTSRFDKVPLNFHHIYAKVDIKVYAENPITIMSFKMMIPEGSSDEIPNKGNYDLTSGWNTKDVTQNDWLKRFADYTYFSTSGKSIPNVADNAIVLCSHLEMQHVFPESGRTFNITFTDVNGNNYAGSITLNASNNGDLGDGRTGWEQNKHYIYTLKINNTDGASEVILFAVDMETWKWQAGNTTEDEQHNW